MPNQVETWYMLWADGTDKVIMNVEESSFSGVVFTVSRLVGIEKIIRWQVTG